VNEPLLRFALDSAISRMVVFERAFEGLDIEHNKGSLVNIATHAGTQITRLGLLRTLRVGSETLTDLQVALISGAIPGRSESGILPLCLFRSVYFNNKQGFVILNPRIKR
jgi:hypothetical protein